MTEDKIILKSRLFLWAAIIAIAMLAAATLGIGSAKAANGTVEVTVSPGSRANIRSAASLNSGIIGKATRGQRFTYVDTIGSFFKIQYNGTTAYLHNSVAKAISTAQPVPSRSSAQTGTVKVNTTLNVRSGAGTQYKVVGSLKNGTKVEVLSKSGSWYQIKYGSITGYVSEQYLVVSGTSSTPAPTPTPVPAPEPQPGILSGKVVFIDAGHGGTDPGTTNAGYKEKDLNLAVANKTVELLRQAGATVIPTRTADVTVELYDRTAMVNKYILEQEKKVAERELADLQKTLNKEIAQKQSLEQQKKVLQERLLYLDDQAYKLNVAISAWKNLQDIKSDVNVNPSALSEAEKRYNDAVAALDDEYMPEQNDNDVEATLTAYRDAVRAEIDDIEDKSIPALNKAIDEVNAKLKKVSDKEKYISDINGYIASFTWVLNNNQGNTSKTGYPSKADMIKIFDIEKKYQDNIIFVSIHGNSTGTSSGNARGAQVYYMAHNTSTYYNGYNTAERYRLAETLLEEVPKANGLSRNLKYPSPENFAVLREANVVSALIELGFLNNTDDRALLMNPTVQHNSAVGIYNAIVKYFND
ncbi:N-acetylmuramoyl-L-alanine amidase [Mahella australiensis]|uniref:Cell wall hydrolase/autolysin n=1 Tax=Mahella australiensis (strain DSM 15567 / CIP 107919 / 50-1 BON) TaxID=697281 RepID=F4A2U9_MAHA5|nr:N-acetylmuramoyl-L-alanine amidase [Mahella australiensis]AEE97292.1 cell wall hydrolase/autolysin [Mahella australiensis 50-1 BON]